MSKQAEDMDEKEVRYKQLMHLLTKSQFYAENLLEKIRAEEISMARQSKEDKENQDSQSSSSSNNSQCGKRKYKSELKGSAKKKRKTGLKVSDIITKEEVSQYHEKASTSQGMASDQQEPPPILLTGGILRPYQTEGLKWLKTLFENGINGILADEMGLGKTIQCISLVCYLIEMKVQGPFLIIAPLSTLPNWMVEFKRFAPKIPVILYHGNETVRKSKQKGFLTRTAIKECSTSVHPVVVTSYECAVRDIKTMARFPWRYLVVDEGHRLKNNKSKLTRCLSKIQSTNSLLLTGTPLQNNMAELWSLLHFLLPDIFDSLSVFESWFDVEQMMDSDADEKILRQEREQQIVSTLHKILSPFLLRRVKSQVDIQLPKKKELIVYTPMTSLQRDLYAATLKDDILSYVREPEVIEYDSRDRPVRKSKGKADYASQLKMNESDKEFQKYLESIELAEKTEPVVETKIKKFESNFKMQNKMMQLKKIVNHPYLVRYPLTEEGEYKVDEDLVKASGKLQILEQILKRLQENGHKVLLFSQMTKILDIFEDYLRLRPQFTYRRLDGNTSLDDRGTDITEFNEDPDIFMYLVSTRAGGLGINLTAADTVIIYDSDWNPQQDLQAQDRCHRFGQTKPVLVLRLCVEGTIDQKIIDRAATKRKLEKLILKSGKFRSGNFAEREDGTVMNTEELVHLLHQSDHDGVRRADSGEILSESELTALLDRSNWSVAPGKKPDAQYSGVFREIVPMADRVDP